MRHQTIDKWKGTAAAAGPPGPGGPKPCRCRRPLSFVYGLMSHCIDRFHFVFYLYTFHFMLPMCIRLIFLVIFSIFLCMVQSLCKPCPVCKPVPCPPPNDFHMKHFSTSLTWSRVWRRCTDAALKECSGSMIGSRFLSKTCIVSSSCRDSAAPSSEEPVP